MISTYSFLWHPKSKRLVFIVLSILSIRMYATNWGAPTDLNNDQHQDAKKPQLALNTEGNAIIVWSEKNRETGTYNIFTRAYDGSNWAKAIILSKNEHENADDPQVSFNNTGHASVVWSESLVEEWHASSFNTFTRIYDGTHWSEALNFNCFRDANVHGPRTALSEKDHVITAWHEEYGKIENVFARNYDETGWAAATNVSNNQSKKASNLRIALNSKGNSIIMWAEKNADNDEDNIFVRTYNGKGWSTARNLNYDQYRNSYSSHVALDEYGNARIIWCEAGKYGSDYIYNIFTRTYDGTRWSDASKLNYKHAIYPVASVNKGDQTIIVWCERNDLTNVFNIFARIYDGPYLPAVVYNLSNNQSAHADSPQVSLNEKGQALVAWREYNGSCYNVFASTYAEPRYPYEPPWSKPSNLNKDRSYEANCPQVSLNEKGEALVTWQEKTSENINHVFVCQTVLP